MLVIPFFNGGSMRKLFYSSYVIIAVVAILIGSLLPFTDARSTEYLVMVNDYEHMRPPPPPPPEYEFVVNRSTFMMDVYLDGELIESRRVIIGKPGRETPVMETEIKMVELNPTWDVPKSIASDMVRKFKSKKDPVAYIKRLGYYFVGKDGKRIPPESIDWKTIANNGPYEFQIKQKPGHLNMLGEVMLVMENSNGIQMHGTSTPRLFDEQTRQFSSGCIRVDGVNELVAMLLEKELDEFHEYREDIGNGKWLRLPTPIKVKVVD
jgi:murein L,D-transpeptidase YcbB/YkuD